MLEFILRRLFQGVLVVFGVTATVFVVTRLVGDPVALMLPLSATEAQRAAFAQQIGLTSRSPRSSCVSSGTSPHWISETASGSVALRSKSCSSACRTRCC